MGTSPRTCARFRRTRWRAGYSPDEVDAFVARVEEALESPEPRIGAPEVNMHRFTPVRLMAGYDPDDVDSYLDGAAEELNKRQHRR
jgi:DivIVA domain-containing protein